MKKLALLVLAGLILFTAVVPFASAAVNKQGTCNSNHVSCREYVFSIDEPWYKMAVMLTGCDVAFGKCMLGL